MNQVFEEDLLVSIYDHDNPDGPDHDFYRQLTQNTRAERITDLGCGTGILTVTLAGQGRTVTGIDPSKTMLAYARAHANSHQVTWVEGTSSVMEKHSADLVLMTGNVAMHIIGDSWHQTLQDIAGSLAPGGTLAFEARNPLARAWEQWPAQGLERQTPAGKLRETTRVEGPDEQGRVLIASTHEFLDHRQTITSQLTLEYRSYGRIVSDLEAVGLSVEACYRNWRQDPFTPESTDALMVFVAVNTH
ncbi:hypothetical protein A7979_00910 [Rothia nasimurium]|uniref:Methyltransferase domain-containing protein n=1 Tax=Rothia nasimurium TaxID=85336 RepID=A0A1Y1RRR8_9MICC|nr:class I SAM-dependent methyltransferase [Rothia nasimurium]ORC22102.1 hypothetical protein A7979_00910 [Rothia nasimurium]